jgi:hypothetical protein
MIAGKRNSGEIPYRAQRSITFELLAAMIYDAYKIDLIFGGSLPVAFSVSEKNSP